MDDAILRYYEAEMRYLGEAAKEFADAHPDRARMLNLDRVGDRDPYVERLFEGFAFLTGRLRQKLDDELPELTEGLVSLLWPHYLRMIPSLSILEMTPAAGTLQKTENVPAGLAVRSGKVGASGVQCLYRTTQAVTLMPIRLTEATPSVRHDARSVIRFKFEIDKSAPREALDLSRIRLYLNADLPVAFALHLALTRQTQSLSLRIPDVQDGAATPLQGAWIEAAGFSLVAESGCCILRLSTTAGIFHVPRKILVCRLVRPEHQRVATRHLELRS